MKLSVVIPAHNEEGCIEHTVRDLHRVLNEKNIPHEILVINDHSKDQTENILKKLNTEIYQVRYLNNQTRGGFGLAVRCGLDNFKGDAVCVYMADASDSPKDIVRFYEKMQEGFDCVFGSRWEKESRVTDYPKHKLLLNRLVNYFIQIIFGIGYNDITNAFKMYRAHVVPELKPFLSNHFNLTVELPLKAIIRGFSYAIIPNDWTNRTTGVSKLKIEEMGSRYLFIILYCFLEKWLSRGDYRASKNP